MSSIIVPKLNPIFEAINYISNKINGKKAERIMLKIMDANPNIKPLISELWNPTLELERILNREITVDSESYKEYFHDMFSSASPVTLASVLMEPITYFGFISDLDELKSKLLSMNEQELVCHTIAGIGEDIGSCKTRKDLFMLIMGLNIDLEERYHIIDAIYSYTQKVEHLIELLRPVVECINKHINEFLGYIDQWQAELSAIPSIESYISDHLGVTFDGKDYTIFPILMDYSLFSVLTWRKCDAVECGEFGISTRMVRYSEATSQKSSVPRIVDILKGLADETRYELLRCINSEETYGNALADKFGMTHQKVFYHMSRMFSPNIVECTSKNGRTYYSINRNTIIELIEALKEFIAD